MGVERCAGANQLQRPGWIQARHYDRHDYMPNVTAALTAWAKYLETVPRITSRTSASGRARAGSRSNATNHDQAAASSTERKPGTLPGRRGSP